MLKNIFTSSATRLQEEMLYEVVAEEIDNKGRRPGLWAKAFAMSNGDENAAEAKYILLRVQSLRDEIKEQSKELKAQQVVETQQQTESKLRAQTQAKETYPFPSDKAMQNIKQACKVEDHISLIKFIHQFGYRVTILEPYGKSLDQTFSVQLPTGNLTYIKGKFSFISFVKREILSSK
jgi:hypothetical protein